MGKIKTAAEIAMEKTRQINVKNDTAEKYTKYIKAAKVLATSLLESKSDAEKIMEALKRYPEEALDAVKKVFFRSFAENINLSNTPDILKMIHHLTADEVILKATAEVNSIFQHCHMKLKEHLKEAGRNNEELMRQKLAAEGIRGSAIYRINRHNDILENISSRWEAEYRMQLSGFRSFLSQNA
ncbi:MAG: hypothetical protein WAO23_08100 [Dethiobacteria bacterium]